MTAPKVLVYCGVNECEMFGTLVPRFDLCFGFEADPRLAKLAQERFVGQPHVHIVHAALCEQNGTVQFNVHDSAAASSLGRLGDSYRKSTGNEIRAVTEITVPAINLYDFLVSRKVEYVDLYYSDIQGMDFTVLCTLGPMIAQRAIKEITCETERDNHEFQAYEGLPPNRQSLFSQLLGESYRIVEMQKVMPDWAFQDVTWKLKPRYLLAWPLRRAGLGRTLRGARGLLSRPRLRRTKGPAPIRAGHEREAPSAWPARPAMPEPEAAAACSAAEHGEIPLPALRLLTPYRFDIPAKYLYAKHREKRVGSDFARRLYAEHLRVWNNLHEIEPVKHGIEAYLDTFHRILDSTKSDGFGPTQSAVPVGRSLSPINGSHRIAACLLYDKEVRCRVVDEGLETHNHNYLYFRNREDHVPGGLAPDLQNAIALEYCRLKPETYAVLVFPSAVGRHREIFDILVAHGHVVYEKEFVLGPNGRLNFIRCVYWGEPWLGTAENGYPGANAKAGYCFANDGPLRLFVFETHDPERAVTVKAEIRALFDLEKNSVHINDSHEETLRVAEALLNANSVHFLERSRPGTPIRLLEQMARLRDWLDRERLSPEDVCIGGSAVLVAYGLREGKDLDFLHHFALPDRGLPEDLGSHNEYAELYGLSPDELIYDPANHFHFNGFKFVSLPIVARMKKTRGERKDAADLALIRKVL
jgi:FkbM family methyltransferase